ncbi:MAG: LysR substrate-binding domain-containing protein [Pseudomonadota bacterium]
MSLSISRLEAVRRVAENGSYAAAARVLGVSQPNVSTQVRALESHYGVRLFLREAGRLVPTPLCVQLCDAVERMAGAREDAERLLLSRSSLSEGRLAVGLGNVMPGMALLAAFHRAFPGVAIRVETGSHKKITRAVLTHEVDVGVLPEVATDRRFRREHLVRNEVVAIAPLDHPLAAQESVSLARLRREPLIFRAHGSSTQRVVDRLFARSGALPVPFLTLDARDGLYEAVVNGLGIGFLWRHGTSRRDGVKRLRIQETQATDTHETAFALAETHGRIVEAFFSMARAFDSETAG